MTKLNPAIIDGVVGAIASVADNPGLPITPSQGPAVAKAVLDKLAADPTVVNATNSEPWYQSRVAWGSIVAIAAPLAGLLLKQTIDANTQSQIGTVLTAAGGAVGGAYALYYRLFGKGKAPLGG